MLYWKYIQPRDISVFLSLPQASRPYCQTIWKPGLCRQLSATSAVMRRASLCAGTMTAGASALWTTHSVIALRWIWGLWKPVCCKSDFPGTRPTKTLRSQVSVFLLVLIWSLQLSHHHVVRGSSRQRKQRQTGHEHRGQLHPICEMAIHRYTEEQFLK